MAILKENIGNLKTSQNLINETYLHSNPHNFLNFANLNIRMNPPNKIIETLKKLEAQANAKEQIFYYDFGVKDADEFSRKYLLYGWNKKDLLQAGAAGELTLQQKVIFCLNQQNVLNALIERTEEQVQTAFNNFIKSDLFVTSIQGEGIAFVGDISKDIKTLLNSSQYRQNIAKKLDLPSPVKRVKVDTSEYFRGFKDAINKSSNDSLKKAKIDNVISAFKANYIELTKEELTGDNKKIFEKIAEAIRVNLRTANRDIFTAKSSAIGVLLEASFLFFEEDFNIEGLIPIEGVMKGTEGGKTDVVFIGKSGKRYNIQLKNSFSNTNYYSMRMSNQTSFNYFLQEMDNASILKSAEELSYMFVNTEFLKSNGLYKGMSPFNLGGDSLKRMYNYINQLLSYALVYYTGNSFIDETQLDLSSGNLFFIYKGRRLIPISFFITTTIIFLQKFTRSVNSGGFRASFGKQTSSNVQNLIKVNANLNPKNLYAAKYEEIEKLSPGYSYPGNLMKVGASAGQSIKDSAKINSTYFDLSIKQLKEQLGSSL